MAFLKTKRSQFIAWMFIYALAVAVMASKGGEEGMFFLWGFAPGAGAGIATTVPGPTGRWKRLGVVLAWLLACWLLTFPLLWSHLGSESTAFIRRAEHALAITLLLGLPALLALLVWIFRRPK